MICNHQGPGSSLEALNIYSPPSTPRPKTEPSFTNFLISSHGNPIGTTTTTTTTTHMTTANSNTPTSSPTVSKSTVDDSIFNFNIPHFIPADTSLTKQEANVEYQHFLSPVSSPEQSELPALDYVATTLLPPASSSPSQQQRSCDDHRQQHHHHQQQQQQHRHHQQQQPQHHLPRDDYPGQLDQFPLHSIEKYSEQFKQEDLTSLTTNFHYSANISNNNSNTDINNNNNNNANNNNDSISQTNAISKEQKHSIVPNNIPLTVNNKANNNSLRYRNHSDHNSSRYRNQSDHVEHFHSQSLAMGETDMTSDVNNNSSHCDDHTTASTTSSAKNDGNKNSYMADPQNVLSQFSHFMPLLDCQDTHLHGGSGAINDLDLSLLYLHSFNLNPSSHVDLSPLMPDVQMRDSTDYDITDPRSVASGDELDDLPDLLDITSHLPCSPDNSCSTSGDDSSETDCNYLHLQPLQITNFSSPLFDNPPVLDSYHGDNYQPHSPNSDEGFEEGPPAIEENLPLLPFNGFQEIIDTEQVTVDVDIKKKPRKRQNSLKPKKKPATASPPGERRKPGRKPGQVSNVLHLWEFMRDLLHEPITTSGIIEWISKNDGVFRVVNSSEVARLWGEKKNNKKAMTYEKLSRSLRYSREEGYFDNIPKDKNYPKKLCFKFGPKSKDWSVAS